MTPSDFLSSLTEGARASTSTSSSTSHSHSHSSSHSTSHSTSTSQDTSTQPQMHAPPREDLATMMASTLHRMDAVLQMNTLLFVNQMRIDSEVQAINAARRKIADNTRARLHNSLVPEGDKWFEVLSNFEDGKPPYRIKSEYHLLSMSEGQLRALFAYYYGSDVEMDRLTYRSYIRDAIGCRPHKCNNRLPRSPPSRQVSGTGPTKLDWDATFSPFVAAANAWRPSSNPLAPGTLEGLGANPSATLNSLMSQALASAGINIPVIPTGPVREATTPSVTSEEDTSMEYPQTPSPSRSQALEQDTTAEVSFALPAEDESFTSVGSREPRSPSPPPRSPKFSPPSQSSSYFSRPVHPRSPGTPGTMMSLSPSPKKRAISTNNRIVSTQSRVVSGASTMSAHSSASSNTALAPAPVAPVLRERPQSIALDQLDSLLLEEMDWESGNVSLRSVEPMSPAPSASLSASTVVETAPKEIPAASPVVPPVTAPSAPSPVAPSPAPTSAREPDTPSIPTPDPSTPVTSLPPPPSPQPARSGGPFGPGLVGLSARIPSLLSTAPRPSPAPKSYTNHRSGMSVSERLAASFAASRAAKAATSDTAPPAVPLSSSVSSVSSVPVSTKATTVPASVSSVIVPESPVPVPSAPVAATSATPDSPLVVPKLSSSTSQPEVLRSSISSNASNAATSSNAPHSSVSSNVSNSLHSSTSSSASTTNVSLNSSTSSSASLHSSTSSKTSDISLDASTSSYVSAYKATQLAPIVERTPSSESLHSIASATVLAAAEPTRIAEPVPVVQPAPVESEPEPEQDPTEPEQQAMLASSTSTMASVELGRSTSTVASVDVGPSISADASVELSRSTSAAPLAPSLSASVLSQHSTFFPRMTSMTHEVVKETESEDAILSQSTSLPRQSTPLMASTSQKPLPKTPEMERPPLDNLAAAPSLGMLDLSADMTDWETLLQDTAQPPASAPPKLSASTSSQSSFSLRPNTGLNTSATRPPLTSRTQFNSMLSQSTGKSPRTRPQYNTVLSASTSRPLPQTPPRTAPKTPTKLSQSTGAHSPLAQSTNRPLPAAPAAPAALTPTRTLSASTSVLHQKPGASPRRVTPRRVTPGSSQRRVTPSANRRVTPTAPRGETLIHSPAPRHYTPTHSPVARLTPTHSPVAIKHTPPAGRRFTPTRYTSDSHAPPPTSYAPSLTSVSPKGKHKRGASEPPGGPAAPVIKRRAEYSTILEFWKQTDPQ